MRRLINQRPGRGERLLLGALPFLALAVLYVIASQLRLAANAGDKLLPPASAFLDTLRSYALEEDLRSGRYLLWSDTWASLRRLLSALLISSAIGLTLALAIGADWAYTITLYVLLATWPISVYLGSRLLGWERWVAAAAALVSPLVLSTPGYGYEHGSYTWRGLGVWSQEWAMWLLPIALGLSWRAVSRSTPTRYAVAALVVGLTAACHFLTGYLAFLSLGVWVLIRPSDLWRRIGRAALVGFGALLIISWVVVPLLLDSRWTSQSRYLKGTFWFDSFGARKVLAWLFTGQLFDGTRASPVISVLARNSSLATSRKSGRPMDGKRTASEP